MMKEEITALFGKFESISCEVEGIECWSARELQPLLGYAKWDNFINNVVVKANRNGKYPNLRWGSVNAVTSSFWRVSGTRVKLNRVTLAYRIPSKYTKMIGIESCRFNITGQNLLSFYNPYPDNFIDPMTTYGNYPTLRKFTIGVNLTF